MPNLHPAKIFQVSLALLCTILGGRATEAQTSFHPLGATSAINAISADGTTAAGFAVIDHALPAVTWSLAGGVRALSVASDPYSGRGHAFAVSADASVIAGASYHWDAMYPSATRATRWTSDGVALLLFDPDLFDPWASSATGVSGDGGIIVGWREDAATKLNVAFRWTQATGATSLSTLPGAPAGHSYAGAISADGLVIAGATPSVAGGSEAFLWAQKDGMVGCGDLPGGSRYASFTSLSHDGSVAAGIGTSDNNTNPNTYEALRFTADDGMVALGDLPGGEFHSAALAILADGSNIVGYGTTSDGHAAFIWTANTGMQNLQELLINKHGLADAIKGWTLNYATGISADGRTITGYGRSPDRSIEGWMVQLGDACRADFNGDSTLDSQDFFDFLDAFISGDPDADFNRDKHINSQDFFEFLTAFFEGCN